MIEKDYDDLQHSIRKVCHEYKAMFDKLDEILSRPDKEFDITFKDHEFKFFPSTTEEEAFELKVYRRMLVHMILQHCSENFILTLRKSDTTDVDFNTWDIVLAFAQGVDPEDCKLEKSCLKSNPDTCVSDTNPTDPDKVSVPLDIDRDVVQMQRQELYDHTLEEELYAE